MGLFCLTCLPGKAVSIKVGLKYKLGFVAKLCNGYTIEKEHTVRDGVVEKSPAARQQEQALPSRQLCRAKTDPAHIRDGRGNSFAA